MPSVVQNKHVHVIGHFPSIENIFVEKGAIITPLDKASIVVWGGGSDVDPKLYNETKHPRTHSAPDRDKFEQACWFRAQKKSRLCVGICRGGQFLNVMNGGALWQDVDRHGLHGEHEMFYRLIHRNGAEVKKYSVTSTHHQQMIPNRHKAVKSEVWGFAGISTVKESGLFDAKGNRIIFRPSPGHSSDAEIIWYPTTRSLCFQPHPEYNSLGTRELFFTCIERALAA